MTLCTIAELQSRQVATADVKGAFLEALMVNDVFMEIDREMTSILVAQFPSYNNFVHNG
jgi:hypothetical protein